MSENSEKKPKLKSIFQWAAAFVAPFGCESPQFGYDQAGFTWDYAKTWYGSKQPPKLT